MAKSVPREVTVIRSQSRTHNMQRITLGGDSPQDFSEGMKSVYIKFLFPLPGATELPSAAEMVVGVRSTGFQLAARSTARRRHLDGRPQPNQASRHERRLVFARR